MKRCCLVALLACSIASAESRWGKVYRWSVVAMAGATALDAASSWGRLEANPLLRGSRGRFGLQGILLKGAMMTGAVVVQRRLGHHKAAAISNFATAGAFGGVAIYNFRLAASAPQNKGAVITPGATSFGCAGCSNPWTWGK